MCVRGPVGFVGGAPEVASEEKERRVLGPRLQIGSSGKQDVTVFHILSAYRYKDYSVVREVLENVELFKIFYVAANDKEEFSSFEASNNSRSARGNFSADINLPFGFVANLGEAEVGAQSAVVKSRESIQIQRRKHAALVVYGKTKSKGLISRSVRSVKSCIDVVLEVYLEKTQRLLRIFRCRRSAHTTLCSRILTHSTFRATLLLHL